MAEAGVARQAPAGPEEASLGPGRENGAWAQALKLPCLLSVELALPAFSVGMLMKLEKGMVIDSHWSVTDDLPLRVNGQVIAWSEFEVVGERLAVRLTELPGSS